MKGFSKLRFHKNRNGSASGTVTNRCNSSALLNYYTLRDAQKLHFMQFCAAGLGFSRILRKNTSRDSGRLNGYHSFQIM